MAGPERDEAHPRRRGCVALAAAPAALHRFSDEPHRAIQPLRLHLDFLAEQTELILIEVGQLDRRDPAWIDT